MQQKKKRWRNSVRKVLSCAIAVITFVSLLSVHVHVPSFDVTSFPHNKLPMVLQQSFYTFSILLYVINVSSACFSSVFLIFVLTIFIISMCVCVCLINILLLMYIEKIVHPFCQFCFLFPFHIFHQATVFFWWFLILENTFQSLLFVFYIFGLFRRFWQSCA